MYRLSGKICRLVISTLLSFNLTFLYAIPPHSEDYGFGVCIPKYVSAPNPWEGNQSKLESLIKNEAIHRRQKLKKHEIDITYQQRKREIEVELAAFLKNARDPYTPGQEPFKIQIKKDKNGKLIEQERGKVNRGRNIKAKLLKKAERDDPIAAKVEKDEKELHRVFRVFREESFGSSAEESRVLWDSSVIMMLLLNRYKSISSTLNKTLKRYTPHAISHSTLLVESIFWEPKWVTNRGKDVSLKVVHLYFLNYLDKNPEAALEFLKKNEFMVLKKNLNAFVPYRDLREAIRVSEQREGRIKAAFEMRRYVYEAIHDGDVMGLRGMRGLGLYSYYIQLIAGNRAGVPHILSTGYQAYYDPQQFKSHEYTETEYYHIMRAIEEDRHGREALSKINFNLIYISEPNFLVRIPTLGTSGMMPYSFMGTAILGKHNKYEEGPAESGMILAKLRVAVRQYVGIFDASHPILMRLPNRFLLLKKQKTSIKETVSSSPFSGQNDLFSPGNFKVLKLVENIAQTVFSFRDLAIIIYRQLELKGGPQRMYEGARIDYPNALFTSLLAQIFNAYDPIKMIEEKIGKAISAKKVKEALVFVLTRYRELSRDKFVLNAPKAAGNVQVNGAIKKLNTLGTKVSQIAGLRFLVDEIFGQGIFDILHDGAKVLGEMRATLLHRYFVAPSLQQDSPHKIKELSEQKIQEERTEKEKRSAVRKLNLEEATETVSVEGDIQRCPILPAAVKQETKAPIEKQEEAILKHFSPETVMTYLTNKAELTLSELNSLAEYKGNASRNMTRLRKILDRERWKTLLRNLEAQHPAVVANLKSEFVLLN